MCSVLFLPVQSLLTCFRNSYSLYRLCLSLSSLITLPQTVRLFYAFHCVLRLSNSSNTVLSFFSSRCEGMATVTNWPLHMHYGITLWAYLSQTHRPHPRYYIEGIAFWTSRKRQSQTSQFDGKTTILRAPTHVITNLPLHTCYREVYGNTAREENGWLSAVAVSL